MNAERPASYEVVLDGVSGDALPLFPVVTAAEHGQNPTAGIPVATGAATSLRFRVDQLTPASPVPVWVEGAGCNADCGPDDSYRLRFYETTLAGGRFNNVGAQPKRCWCCRMRAPAPLSARSSSGPPKGRS